MRRSRQRTYKTKKNKQGKVTEVLDKQGNKIPLKTLRSRTDPAVQGVLQKRRGLSLEALAALREMKTLLLMLKISRGWWQI